MNKKIYRKYLKKNLGLLIIVTITNYILWGCANPKVASCKLIKRVSTDLSENIDAYVASEDVSKIREVVNTFSIAQDKIVSLTIEDQTLLNYAQNLAQIYQQYSQATQEYLSAFENQDLEKVAQKKQEIQEIFSKQTKAIEDINNYCSQ